MLKSGLLITNQIWEFTYGFNYARYIKLSLTRSTCQHVPWARQLSQWGPQVDHIWWPCWCCVDWKYEHCTRRQQKGTYMWTEMSLKEHFLFCPKRKVALVCLSDHPSEGSGVWLSIWLVTFLMMLILVNSQTVAVSVGLLCLSLSPLSYLLVLRKYTVAYLRDTFTENITKNLKLWQGPCSSSQWQVTWYHRLTNSFPT